MSDVEDGTEGVDSSIAKQQIEQLNSDLEFSKKKEKSPTEAQEGDQQ